jgi:protein SCO1/2
MPRLPLFFVVLLSSVLSIAAGAEPPAAAADPETEARTAVAELGEVNGLALACKNQEVAARAKALMIGHVPKLRDWGDAYETATSKAFLAPPGGCPDAATLRVRAEVIAARISRLLPASPANIPTQDPDAGITPRYLLKGPDGQAVMDSDFHGRFQLIAFGYTYCPDICPTTLIEMATILKQIGDDAAKIQPIFISVDPERDTPAQLKAYTGFFDTRILGLTGSPELVRRVADFFKVRYEKVQVPGASHYSVDHSAGMYLLGPDGAFVAKLAYGTPVGELVERVHAIVAQAPAAARRR